MCTQSIRSLIMTSFCHDGPETFNPEMRERLKILFLAKMSVRKLCLLSVTPVGGHYLHRSCRCLVNWKEPRSQTTMRRRSNDTTSCLPPVLQERQNKQRSRRHEDTDAHISSPPVNFLLLLPRRHTSHCLSPLPPSLAVMLLWLHSKGYAVYPPSLPVTPLPPAVTHTHTLAPPQSPALSTIYRPCNHDTYSLPLLKGL